MEAPIRSGRPEAAALVVGSEILLGRTQDTNTLFLIGKLLEKGIRLGKWIIVPDDKNAISAGLNWCVIEGFDPVFVSGGMGPTHDDITVQAVAEGLGLSLDHDDGSFMRMVEKWRRINPGKEIPEASMNGLRKMSDLPEGFRTIPNKAGMVEGLYGLVGEHDTLVVILPGVPKEYISIVSSRELDDIVPRAESKLKIVDIPFKGRESQIARTLKELQERFPEVEIGSYPQGHLCVIIRLIGREDVVTVLESELKGLLGV